jgi:hypothetical protein
MLRKFAKMIVAGADFDPRVGDTDQGFGEIIIAQACGTEHGTRGRAMSAVGKSAAARPGQLFGHCGCPFVAGCGVVLRSSAQKNLGPSPCFG